ncbi:hypothetical protein [Variovorax boronicumulans]|nr:hypothetical protein [Variovorax boronicumulans]
MSYLGATIVPVIPLVADVLVSVACIVYLVVDVRRFFREHE